VTQPTASEPASGSWSKRLPLIERYREWLPVTAQTPVVTLFEGSTPLVPAHRLSERLGVEGLPECGGSLQVRIEDRDGLADLLSYLLGGELRPADAAQAESIRVLLAAVRADLHWS